MSLSNLIQFQTKDFGQDYRLRAMFNLIPATSGDFLDIGSGNGETALFLSRMARNLYVTDKNEVLLENLRAKFKNKKNVRIRKINAQKFKWSKNNFDLITACDVMEHLKNDLQFLKCCRRHLKRNGLLFLSVPAGNFLYGCRDRKYGHYRRYSKVNLEEKIKQADFELLRCQYWNFIGWLPYLISEKNFRRELVGPARGNNKNFISRLLNNFLYFWLLLEGKFSYFPFGLTLVAVAKRK